MAATITFKVSGITPSGANMANISFEVSAVVDGGQPFATTAMMLTFPREVGKEFELDDTYALQIAPKAEGQH